MNLFPSEQSIADRFNPDANLVLYRGDAQDFLGTVPSNSIALIVTSPPYNIGKDYEQKTAFEKYLQTQAKSRSASRIAY